MIDRKKFKVGIYIRLSREDDKKQTESESITSQRDQSISYINENNCFLVDEYVDDGYSGTNFERPGFIRLIEDIEKGKINMVITKDLSRLGRDHILTGYYIEQYFPLNGIRYVAINDSYDSSLDSVSNDFAPFKSVFNDMYACDISKKVKSSLMIRKRQGKFTGWKAPYGYKRDPVNKHKLIIDEEVSVIVKRIFDMAFYGKSAKQIADILSKDKIPIPSVYANLNRGRKSSAYGLWCGRTIAEMLTNHTYIGNMTQGRRKKLGYKIKKETRTPIENWIIVKNTHPAIIEKELFDAVQNIVSKNKNKTKSMNAYLLNGFLFCKECGHAIGISKSSDKKRSYCACTYYRKYSKHNVCSPHTVNYDKLESAILNSIIKVCSKQIDISDFTNILKKKDSRKQREEEINNKIELTNNSIKSLLVGIDKAYIDKVRGIIDEDFYKRVYEKINDDILNEKKCLQELQIQLHDIKTEKMIEIDYKKKVEDYISFKKPDRLLLANLIDKIYIHKNKEVDIIFKFKLT